LKSQNIYLSNNNWVYDLQRSDIVADGTRIFLLCFNGIHPSGFLCRNNVFDPPLESVSCSRALKASFVNVPDTSCPTGSLTYAVGYSYNGRLLELFRNCYDHGRLSLDYSIYKTYRYTKCKFVLIYTHHHILKTAFLAATRPTSPYWYRDLMMTPQEVVAYKRQVSQACVTTALGGSQPDCVFDRGHVTPSSAFIFSEFKRATYRYLNVVPQYNLVNIGNWENIEAWVTRLVMGHYDLPYRAYDVLKVCTGVLGVHNLPHSNNQIAGLISIYLYKNNKIPVPKWMYKIVSHLSGDKWVFLTYNDVNLPSLLDLNQICNQVACPNGLNRSGVGYTVCCEPFGFIQNNIDYLTGVC